MTKYNFDEIIPRENTNSVKFEIKNVYPSMSKDAIPMWVADMDFACAQPILDAMHRAIDNKIIGYTGFFNPDYKEAVKNWYKRRFDWDINTEEIVYSGGVVRALILLVQILTKPTDGVIFVTPSYNPFNMAIVSNGRTPVKSKLIEKEGRFEFDFEDIECKCKEKNNTLFILCNPHNPTGRVWSKEELIRLVKICKENNVNIISDEIHSDLVRTNVKHIPTAKLFPDSDIITCTAPSKTFNLAANSLSNIIIPKKEWRTAFENTHLAGFPSPMAIAATIAAYTECEDWLDSLKIYLDENMKLFYDTIKEKIPKIKFNIPEGTYMVWLNMKGLGLTHEKMLKKVTEDAAIFPEGGEMFVENGENYLRLNLACPRKIVQIALDNLIRVFGN